MEWLECKVKAEVFSFCSCPPTSCSQMTFVRLSCCLKQKSRISCRVLRAHPIGSPSLPLCHGLVFTPCGRSRSLTDRWDGTFTAAHFLSPPCHCWGGDCPRGFRVDSRGTLSTNRIFIMGRQTTDSTVAATGGSEFSSLSAGRRTKSHTHTSQEHKVSKTQLDRKDIPVLLCSHGA